MDINLVAEQEARDVGQPGIGGEPRHHGILAVNLEDRADFIRLRFGDDRVVVERRGIAEQVARRALQEGDFLVGEDIFEHDIAVALEQRGGRLVDRRVVAPVAMDDGVEPRAQLGGRRLAGWVYVVHGMSPFSVGCSQSAGAGSRAGSAG